MSGSIELRLIEEHELHAAIMLEQSCYTPEAAAALSGFRFRYQQYRPFFWTAWLDTKLVGITNGIRTNQSACGDEMKGDQADDPDGIHFCVLTVAVDPHERRRGIGKLLLRKLIQQCGTAGIRKMILICEKQLIPFYEAEKFRLHGVSASSHGGIVWHEMSRTLHTIEHLTE
ncbi:GNAT family N-acetyltransferase [Paenibacillus alkaliterrae]|uniref:GNAT family N-acetyltransferase n=1 Tax=Paenibacillus alkaliterrae TaxID=320909 RepID=UPI001F1B46EE|nr:GNAT family N-acetyltransferase [Paenibacillus alkaliterrae]MCF2938257.1 GNAT family N-acetyltransferase [Paenibacillus alkaliterrae]